MMAAHPAKASGAVATKQVGRDQRVSGGRAPPTGAPTIKPTQRRLPKMKAF